MVLHKKPLSGTPSLLKSCLQHNSSRTRSLWLAMLMVLLFAVLCFFPLKKDHISGGDAFSKKDELCLGGQTSQQGAVEDT